MLVSVHLPKTAGTSFARSLEARFGDRLLTDYADAPLNAPPLARFLRAGRGALASLLAPADADCVHGHFLPVKYRLLSARRPLQFVTWMRDPVERLASHYHYWRREYDPASAHPLHRRVVEEDWSFERFYRSPRLRDVYAQFLWGFGLSGFAFIGITEHYDADFAAFARTFLGGPVPAYRERVNAGRPRAPYVTDPGQRAEIAAIHARDARLYAAAVERRRRRLAAERPEAAAERSPGGTRD